MGADSIVNAECLIIHPPDEKKEINSQGHPSSSQGLSPIPLRLTSPLNSGKIALSPFPAFFMFQNAKALLPPALSNCILLQL
jgi:hypothetical protein